MSNTAFKSVFQAEFENLVKLKRSLGFRYVTEEKAFKRIDSFFCSIDLSEINPDLQTVFSNSIITP